MSGFKLTDGQVERFQEDGYLIVEAFLTDENGAAKGGDPVPEAASVEVGERRGGLVHVRWGATEGWVPATSVRLLGAP